MIIAHEKLIGEDGEPKAAVIPWDVFLAEQKQMKSSEDDELELAWRDEIRDRVKAIDEAGAPLFEHKDVMSRVRASISQVR